MCRAACLVFFSVLALSIFSGCRSDEASQDLPETVDFNYHIRPILSNSCYVCHGPDVSTREADLRLDERAFATARRQGGRAIVPGNARRSILIKKVTAADPEQRMPPRKTNKVLEDREIALLKKWIKQGAEYKKHWAFISPQGPALPEGLAGTGAIDWLLDERHRRAGLSPAPLASKEAQLRRAAYVLTGLPPAPEMVAAFLSDEGKDAYVKAVDTLLASPHFGERWARHWMDLVRYAESKGHEFDFTIQGAWQYRDYLIRAFNADVPYDQFVAEHLAGDLLVHPRLNPAQGFAESPIGTAYFGLGEGKHSPVDTRIDEAERIDNIIDVTTKTFQGLTVACARCHDHKFDPIPTTDYYSLYGIIESARFAPTPLISSRYRAQHDSLIALHQERRRRIAARWQRAVGRTPVVAASLERTVPPASDSVGSWKMIGDFRDGTYDDWYPEGLSFAGVPRSGTPVITDGRIDSLLHGVVTSRKDGAGFPGALRSPTFRITQDSIVVVAAGLNAAMRIVVDNFQLIRHPIHGFLEVELDSPTLKSHVIGMDMWKGSKAYIEFLVGTYHKGQLLINQHQLQLKDNAFFDVAYVAAFDGTRPAFDAPQGGPRPPLVQAVSAWANDNAAPADVEVINEALLSGALPRTVPGSDLAPPQPLPAFFTGMTDGDTVTSGVFFRGNAKNEEAARVPHRFFTALDSTQAPFVASASGRLDLARAMTDPENPLTARVMVNRLWHHVFGRGIVATVDNFGAQGELPTHPELLDYLALRFMEQGWSVKAMLREIVLTRAFRRATEPPDSLADVDPQNKLLTHYPIRRLEAEAIRDGILAASGTLDPTLFGPPVPIHLTAFMKGRGRPDSSGALDGDGRRSLYTAVRRNFLSPMMLAFDVPIPFSTFGRRNTSNVPAQSLTMLNDPFVAAQSQAWGDALVAMPHPSIEARVKHIYLHALSRAPSGTELVEARQYLEIAAQDMALPAEAILDEALLWAAYCHAIFNLKEFIYLI